MRYHTYCISKNSTSTFENSKLATLTYLLVCLQTQWPGEEIRNFCGLCMALASYTDKKLPLDMCWGILSINLSYLKNLEKVFQL